MGTKHDILTEEEMEKFSLSSVVDKEIKRFIAEKNGDLLSKQINILDCGCGRGRSVARLRELGFNAFGVDVDEKTMLNGFDLLEKRGLIPSKLLRTVADVDSFPDGYFHIIFSEQVFEHVSDLNGLIEMYEHKTLSQGIGVHSFPGAKMIDELHVMMPYIHWLPKNKLRKIYIALMLVCGKGPKKGAWLETKEKSFFEIVNVYYQYLDKKTFYRDNKKIACLFAEHAFDVQYKIGSQVLSNNKLNKNYFKRNGYPDNNIIFFVTKK